MKTQTLHLAARFIRGTRSAILVALLLVSAPGCFATRAYFEPIPEFTDATLPVVTPERPLRLLFAPYGGPAKNLSKAVLSRLVTDGSFEVVKVEGALTQDAEFDYRVDFDFTAEGEGTAGNFFRCFPGFLILAPQWAPLSWDCIVTTEVRLKRLSDGKLLAFSRRDGLEMNYTSTGYSTCVHAGWWGLLFSPMAALPLGTGIVAVFDSVDTAALFANLPNSDAGAAWTETITNELLTRIASLERESPVARSPELSVQ